MDTVKQRLRLTTRRLATLNEEKSRQGEEGHVRRARLRHCVRCPGARSAECSCGKEYKEFEFEFHGPEPRHVETGTLEQMVRMQM